MAVFNHYSCIYTLHTHTHHIMKHVPNTYNILYAFQWRQKTGRKKLATTNEGAWHQVLFMAVVTFIYNLTFFFACCLSIFLSSSASFFSLPLFFFSSLSCNSYLTYQVCNIWKCAYIKYLEFTHNNNTLFNQKDVVHQRTVFS